MLERFAENPQKATRDFKTILENNTNWTIDDTLQHLGIENKKELFNNYIQNFDKRTSTLLKEKEEIKSKKSLFSF